MACEYCNVKHPRKNAVVTVGKYPIGKPFFTNRDKFCTYAYAVIAHQNGCNAFPDEDEWGIFYLRNGTGHYIPINYCPICGKKLGDAS